MKPKVNYTELVNELNIRHRYKPVKEEPMPKGFFSSAEMAKKYDTVQRVSQRWISFLMGANALEVRFVRRRINGVFVKKIPVYKFKHKADEKEFKSRLKRKQRKV
jgi:hypothetical protein